MPHLLALGLFLLMQGAGGKAGIGGKGGWGGGATVSSCSSLPYTDSFSSGPLSACWTQTTSTVSPKSNLVASSGTAVPATASTIADAIFTSVYTAGGDQSVQGTITYVSGNFSGFGLNDDGTFTGAFFLPTLNAIYGITNGSGTGSISNCTTATPSGHTYKYAFVASVHQYTVYDVTTGGGIVCQTITGTTTYTGKPAVTVDWRGTTGADSIGAVTLN